MNEPRSFARTIARPMAPVLVAAALLAALLAAPAPASAVPGGAVNRVARNVPNVTDANRLTDDGAFYADGLVLRDTRTGAAVALPVAPTSAIAVSGDGTTYAFADKIVDRATGATYTAPPITPPADAPPGTGPATPIIESLSRDGNIYFAGRIAWTTAMSVDGGDECILRDRTTGREARLYHYRDRGTAFGPHCSAGQIAGDEQNRIVLTRVVEFPRGGPMASHWTHVHHLSTQWTETQLDVVAQGWDPSTATATDDGAKVVTGYRTPSFSDLAAVTDSIELDTATGVTTHPRWAAPSPPQSPSVSGNGRFIVFAAQATPTAPRNVYRHDDVTGATVQLSLTPTGAQPNADSTVPQISGSGAVVVFHSNATNLVADGLPASASGDLYAIHDLPVGLASGPAVLGATAGKGYLFVATDGGIFNFGDSQFFGSTGSLPLNEPIVGAETTATGDGYWLVAADGGIFAFGDAEFFGSTGSFVLNSPIVGMAVTPSGEGYWLVAADGGIFAFGDAAFLGSTGAIRLNSPVVGMDTTATGNGYWLVAADGGIFAFGDAAFFGSAGAVPLNRPIVGMAATTDGNGYWLVAADGGIFAYGRSPADAPFLGSTGALRLNSPIVGMDKTAIGQGYWLVAADGGIFAFGEALFLGSAGDLRLNRPVVGMAATPLGRLAS